RAELDVPGRLGAPGELVTVRARLPADELRNAAEASRAVRLTTPTALTLRALAEEVTASDELEVEGELRDLVQPIAGATIVIGLEEGRALANAVTDGRGRFHARLSGAALPAGTAFVEARHHPEQPWMEPYVSQTE